MLTFDLKTEIQNTNTTWNDSRNAHCGYVFINLFFKLFLLQLTYRFWTCFGRFLLLEIFCKKNQYNTSLTGRSFVLHAASYYIPLHVHISSVCLIISLHLEIWKWINISSQLFCRKEKWMCFPVFIFNNENVIKTPPHPQKNNKKPQFFLCFHQP